MDRKSLLFVIPRRAGFLIAWSQAGTGLHVQDEEMRAEQLRQQQSVGLCRGGSSSEVSSKQDVLEADSGRAFRNQRPGDGKGIHKDLHILDNSTPMSETRGVLCVTSPCDRNATRQESSLRTLCDRGHSPAMRSLRRMKSMNGNLDLSQRPLVVIWETTGRRHHERPLGLVRLPRPSGSIFAAYCTFECACEGP